MPSSSSRLTRLASVKRGGGGLCVRQVEFLEGLAVERMQAGLEIGAVRGAHLRLDLPVFLRLEGLDLQLAVADQAQGLGTRPREAGSPSLPHQRTRTDARRATEVRQLSTAPGSSLTARASTSKAHALSAGTSKAHALSSSSSSKRRGTCCVYRCG